MEGNEVGLYIEKHKKITAQNIMILLTEECMYTHTQLNTQNRI